MVGGWRRPLLPQILRQPARWSKIADFELIFSRSTSAVTSSKDSSINTDRKARTRFPMSLRQSSYVDPKWPIGGSKTQNGRFRRCKVALRLKKACYKVSLYENCQRQSCKAFIGLTILAKMIGGAPSTCNFGSNWPRWSKTADFQSIFAHSTSAVNNYH